MILEIYTHTHTHSTYKQKESRNRARFLDADTHRGAADKPIFRRRNMDESTFRRRFAWKVRLVVGSLEETKPTKTERNEKPCMSFREGMH